MTKSASYLSASALSALAHEYGTPLFVLNETKLADDVDAFVQAFSHHIHAVQVCYSVKTNYTPWVVRKIAQLGVKPEVIAGFELDLVNRLEIDGPLYVNGPAKQNHELRACVDARHIINVDNLDELARLIDIVNDSQTRAEIGLRLRPQGESWKRFGIAFGSESWHRALALIEQCELLTLGGLHMHIGTGIIDLERYRQAAQYLKSVAESLSFPMRFLDIGGGFATQSARLNHYSAEQWQVPSVADYAQVIGEVLNDYLQANDCTLVVEPGRSLIDEAVDLLTSVVSADDERVIVDGGKNVVPSVESRVHPVDALTERSGSPQPFDVFGPLCMGSDCLARELNMVKPEVGDVLAVRSVGAYSQSQSMQFIKYAPAMVAVDRRNKVTVIRRKQTIEDLLVQDQL